MSTLRKVLVVDDDPVVGKSFDRVLTRDKGYVVITAQSGAEALEKMRTQTYDVVFTDIKMPGMDGLELAETMRAAQPWLPIVIITGNGTMANVARASAVDAELMHKPLSPEMIEGSAIHALLARAPLDLPQLVETPAVEVQEVVAPEAAETSSVLKRLMGVGLFFLAPLIGLAYAMLLPVVGMAMLLGIGGKALLQNAKAMRSIRNAALLIAAPFIGLAYAVLLPIVGVGMLAWTAVQAVIAKSE